MIRGDGNLRVPGGVATEIIALRAVDFLSALAKRLIVEDERVGEVATDLLGVFRGVGDDPDLDGDVFGADEILSHGVLWWVRITY
jgi:hypothetical protein